MKYLARKFAQAKTTLLAAVLSSLLLSACGGSSPAGLILTSIGVGGTGIGVGGTGIVLGAITGFGSVYINGTRYDTSNSTFIVDGESLDESALKLGMVVRVEVETEGGEFTGDALKVVYDDEIEGPIDAMVGITPSADGTQKFFEVFGEAITIDDTGTRFEGINFNTIAPNDIVEISGFRTTSPDTIVATYVRKTGVLGLGSEVELRGTIAAYDMGPPETFTINGVEIEIDPTAAVEIDEGNLQDGLYVEVEGTIDNLVPLRILAMKIESEDEDLGVDVDDVRLEGIISEYVDDSNFKIGGQLINASDADITPSGALLGNGLEVEVEGDIVGGVLYTDEVEVEEEESELRSFVDSVDVGDGSFEVVFPVVTMPNTVTVRVDAQTEFEDDTGGPLMSSPFSLDDLVGGGVTDYVIVKGNEVGNEINATLVKRVDAAADEKRRLDGIVDDYTAYTMGADGWITVLGIQYGLNDDTEYDPDDNILVWDFVEIEDKHDPSKNHFIDGIADEIERE